MPTNFGMSSFLRGTEVPRYQKMKSRNKDTAGYSKGQVQNVKSSKVYVFGDDDIHENEIDNGEIEMFNIRSRNKRGNSSKSSTQQANEDTLYFDKEVGEKDSLQSLSVQFACPISELKRLNHLIQDQDFFGLKYVKVPIRKHGIMSETLDQKNIHSQGQASGATYNGAMYNGDELHNDKTLLLTMDESDSAHDFSDPEMQMKIIRTLSIKDNFSSQGKEAEEFLKSMDKDLEKVRNSSRGERGSLNEVISVLGNQTIFPLRARKQPEHLNGADCGIRWWSILLIIFFVIIVLPLGYVIYHYTHNS